MDGTYETMIENASELIAGNILAQERGLEDRTATLDIDVKEVLRQIGARAMTKIFDVLSRRVTASCEARGLKPNRRSNITYSVMFGEITVESPYCWNSSTKESARPVRNVLGLKSRGRSIGVERALSDFGNEESFAQASIRFKEHYGWEIGRTTTLRVVEGHAEAAEGYVRRRLENARAAYDEPLATRPGIDRLLTELDGCEIRTGVLEQAKGRTRTAVRKIPVRKRREAWRDVRVGFAGPVQSKDRTYVARMDSYPVVVHQLFDAACDQGLSSNTDVVAVADGGNGLREELEAQFPRLQFVLDRPHVKQHLYEVAEAIGLKDDARHAWVHEHLTRIDKGAARDVIADLRRYKGRGKKRVNRFVKHLTRFADAVHYEAVREAGLPQGSGEVESCHRWIPQKRLKLPGAWWRPDMVNPMLALRLLRANGWWDDFWCKRAENAA